MARPRHGTAQPCRTWFCPRVCTALLCSLPTRINPTCSNAHLLQCKPQLAKELEAAKRELRKGGAGAGFDPLESATSPGPGGDRGAAARAAGKQIDQLQRKLERARRWGGAAGMWTRHGYGVGCACLPGLGTAVAVPSCPCPQGLVGAASDAVASSMPHPSCAFLCSWSDPAALIPVVKFLNGRELPLGPQVWAQAAGV